MIKAHKLKHYETLTSIKLNEIYVGKPLKNSLVELNENIRAKADRTLDKNEVAVKITKISLPYSVECKIIDEEYEVDEEKADISSFTMEDIGKKHTVFAKVEEVQQTSGPTLFTLFDGTGCIVAKSFVGPGKRAFPELEAGMAIKALLQIKERDNNLEAELLTYNALDDGKEKRLLDRIQDKLSEKANAKDIAFMIRSDILEKLKPRIIKVATEIKKAILESRPIILRHHADCDGYAGAVALQRAILPILIDHHNDERARWKFYRRAPSKAPFYDYTDATRDLTMTLSDMAKFGQKEPLIILVDNGSTAEDILGIKKVLIYDAKVVVIDHHYPGDANIDQYTHAHVNPYLVGGNSSLTAGMLASEVARFINNDVRNISFLPALAGTGDRSSGEEFNQYLDLAAKDGYDAQFLVDLAEAIDFEAHYLRFMEGSELIDDLLGRDVEKQKKLVNLMKSDIDMKKSEQLAAGLNYVRVDESDRFIAELDITKATNRGEFPAAGKTTGMVFDALKKRYHKPGIILGIGEDFITIRATDDFKINVNIMMKELRTLMPYAMINGGGHERAGTIKFVEAAKAEVIEKLKDKI